MTRSRRRAAAWTCVTATAFAGWLLACDEIHADPVTAPFSSFSGFPDSGLTSTRTPPVECPRSARENGPCSQVGGICEYGTSNDQRCNTLFICVGESTYPSYWTEQSSGTCTEVCPDPSLIVDGAPCALTDTSRPEDELHCTTPLGACICTTGRDGAHEHPRRWVCKQPDVDCPPKRPLLGQPCIGQVVCDYGSCESKRGARMICEDDVWQTEVGQCAN